MSWILNLMSGCLPKSRCIYLGIDNALYISIFQKNYDRKRIIKRRIGNADRFSGLLLKLPVKMNTLRMRKVWIPNMGIRKTSGWQRQIEVGVVSGILSSNRCV
jgi:hypothetical protein